MKKVIFIFAMTLISTFGIAQKYTIMNSVAATTTVTAYTVDASPQVGQMGTGITGNLHITTNSAFNGTTSTDSIFTSLDGTNWALAYADDNVTPIVFTMSAGARIYTWKIKSATESFIKIKYSKGNATLGTVKAVLFLR